MKYWAYSRITAGALVGTAALAACAAIVPVNHYAAALLLMITAVVLYGYSAIFVAERNWWDVRAVFSATWIFTIGLAALRLTDYQRQWETATWLILAAGFGLFYLGATVGISLGKKLYHWARSKKGLRIGGFTLALQPERLFPICTVVTVIGMLCFAMNVKIKGFIPYFATSDSAYLDFYTKYYLFAVAATMISGLSYYTLVTQKLAWWKRIVLCISILYSTFAFPLLVVSRGVFLTSALALTTAVFYLHKKRLITLILCAAVILVFYMEGTKARGYTEDQLNAFFEPSTITVTQPEAPETQPVETLPPETQPEQTEPSQQMQPETVPAPTEPAPEQFQLSGSAAFVYSYLTVSHDNFNEAVRLTENHTYGARQLAPFNVILRIPAIDRAVTEGEYHLVRAHLNTVNLAGDAYYDFGGVGVGVMMFLWAVLFGAMQAFYLEGKGPFAMVTLGNAMTPVAMCFFASWMGIFAHWMRWGFFLVLFFCACITRKKAEQEDHPIS